MYTLTAGALIRRRVRAVLDAEGVMWREHKGWLESTFVLDATPRQLRSVRDHLTSAVGPQ